MVTVDNPGNSADSTGYGKVDYEYQIGKYDVTIGQYCAFLNAVAKTDTYELFNASMETDKNIAGISRTGISGAYVYSVIGPFGYLAGQTPANRPITYVSWFDAARFANWMSNGQPTGDQNSTTTENGAYNLNGMITGAPPNKNLINPNTGLSPTFYIPTEDEWCKAAYYSPLLNSGSGGYYLYATQSDTRPENDIGDRPNQANYRYLGSTYSVTQSTV
jgi:formylglycine-generating enzyme required for sulfatase activity